MNERNDPSRELLSRLVAAVSTGRPVVMLLDFDGTLTPIVDRPDQVRLENECRDLLAEMAASSNIFVGIFSGRSIDELKRLVELPGLYYVGTSGLELDLLGLRIDHPHSPNSRPILDEWEERLNRLTSVHPGAWVERKPLGLTLHYRQLSLEASQGYRSEVRRLMRAARGSLRLLEVASAVEVTPELGWNKGTALRCIIDDAARDALPFYAGDAANDGDALVAVKEIGGLAVGVGSDAPCEAEYRLESPQHLIALLTQFVKSIKVSRQSDFCRG